MSGIIFISHNYALAQNASISNNDKISNYNITAGSWVRYIINGPYVHSDNKFLELMVKGMLANRTNFFGNVPGSSPLSSMKDIQWFQINVSRISENNLTIQTEAKPYLRQPIISKPVSVNISSSPFPLVLPKNIQVGEKFPLNYTTFKIGSLVVNRTLQKDIGGHNLGVYELTGQQNSVVIMTRKVVCCYSYHLALSSGPYLEPYLLILEFPQ